MSVIRLHVLTKMYPRGQLGVAGLDLAVEPGEVFGFLGRTELGRPPRFAA